MNMTEVCKRKVKRGGQLTKEEAIQLWEEPVGELCRAADEIRAYFCGNQFDICTIINGKSELYVQFDGTIKRFFSKILSSLLDCRHCLSRRRDLGQSMQPS